MYIVYKPYRSMRQCDIDAATTSSILAQPKVTALAPHQDCCMWTACLSSLAACGPGFCRNTHSI